MRTIGPPADHPFPIASAQAQSTDGQPTCTPVGHQAFSSPQAGIPQAAGAEGADCLPAKWCHVV